jgi:hypothetical protein
LIFIISKENRDLEWKVVPCQPEEAQKRDKVPKIARTIPPHSLNLPVQKNNKPSSLFGKCKDSEILTKSGGTSGTMVKVS